MEKIYETLKDYGFSVKKINLIFENNKISKEDILKNINFVEKRNRVSPMTQLGFRRYLSQALINNYVKNNEIKKIEKNDYLKKIEDNKNEIKNKKTQFNSWFDNLSKNQQDNLVSKYSTGNPLKDRLMIIKSRISIDFFNKSLKESKCIKEGKSN